MERQALQREVHALAEDRAALQVREWGHEVMDQRQYHSRWWLFCIGSASLPHRPTAPEAAEREGCWLAG